MKDKIYYILSVGIAFYIGMKYAKNTIKPKEVVKEVVITSGPSITVIGLKDKLNECIAKHDALVVESNKQIKGLKEDLENCEAKYFCDSNPIHPNLEPELVEEKT